MRISQICEFHTYKIYNAVMKGLTNRNINSYLGYLVTKKIKKSYVTSLRISALYHLDFFTVT